jgi:hypothetical protein
MPALRGSRESAPHDVIDISGTNLPSKQFTASRRENAAKTPR